MDEQAQDDVLLAMVDEELVPGRELEAGDYVLISQKATNWPSLELHGWYRIEEVKEAPDGWHVSYYVTIIDGPGMFGPTKYCFGATARYRRKRLWSE